MFRSLIFPMAMTGIYCVVSIFMPGTALVALKDSLYIFLRIGMALGLVFILIFGFNLFVKPSHLARFFEKTSGIKGTMISVLGGVISIGPIYAWYPLLKELRGRGMSPCQIAIFLNCRAVKPVLLPVMISYFGWAYVLAFSSAIILASLLCGLVVGRFTPR